MFEDVRENLIEAQDDLYNVEHTFRQIDNNIELSDQLQLDGVDGVNKIEVIQNRVDVVNLLLSDLIFNVNELIEEINDLENNEE